MNFVRPGDRPEISDARLLGLHEYWHSKLRGRAMPARGDIDPIEMRRWLGNLLLVEFPPDPMQFRIRLDGVNLVQFYGKSREGKGVEVLTSEEERRIVLLQYMAVLETKQPAYFESEFVTSEGVSTSQRKLLLPLSDDGDRVNMVLAGIYFDRAAK
ncbi:MAG: PAS domain-containing protein [Dongiaceae bacterium]